MLFNAFTRLETLDSLIRSRSTGTPKKLASRLLMSERNLYHFLDVMRELGAPICYCKTLKSYYYAECGSISVRFKKTQGVQHNTRIAREASINQSA
jgi:predicted DNA-binding transcriptional regulator YafY